MSCHHNAIGDKPEVNRTSVWHHRGVDTRPSSLDLGRYLLQGLLDSLAFPQITGDARKSDQLMYRSGFGLLREVDVTAALERADRRPSPAAKAEKCGSTGC